MQLKGIWTNYNSGNCPLPKGSFVSTLASGVNGRVYLTVVRSESHLENGFEVIEGKTEGILIFYQEQGTFHSLRELGILEAVHPMIACDGEGQMWVYAPPKTLYRFDGRTVDTYQAGNQGLPSDLGLVNSFATDSAGSLWMACVPAGVYQFDGRNWRKVFSADNTNSDLWITSLTTDHKGRIWFAAQDKHSTTFAVFEDKQWREHAKVSIGRGDGDVQAMAIDHDETLWVGWGDFGGRGELGLWNMVHGGTKWQQYTVRNSPLFDNYIKSLTVDTKGRVWAGTTGGFAIFHGMDAVGWEIIKPGILQSPLTQEQVERDQTTNDTRHQIRISDYATLDNEGHIWARSQNGAGVFREHVS